MTLRNFDDDTDTITTAPKVVVEQVAPVITQSATVKRAAHAGTAHVGKDPEAWDWEAVRDYVVRSIEERHGVFPRNFKTEPSIFKSFSNRWGNQAGPIAKMAFEVFDGVWKGAPISVNRFCIGSDVYFAAPLAERL
jgi:hypothetical protein